MNRFLKLSHDHRKVTSVAEEQLYPPHPDRFQNWEQLLCRDGLTGRCYWEAEWTGVVYLSVAYRGMGRRGHTANCWFGRNRQSWCLRCSDDGYTFYQDQIKTCLPSSPSNRVAVYVDKPAGSLSFYSVSSDQLIHLHTFSTTFTEHLYPGFGFGWSPCSSVSLCPLRDGE